MAFDIGRAIQLLHNPDVAIVRRTIGRLHIRFWHASAARMRELLQRAGAPHRALNLCKEIVETCRSCRMWARPGPKSIRATLRLASAFNEMVHWGILCHRTLLISHLLDEAIRFCAASTLADRFGASIIAAITVDWLRPLGPMRVLVADQEGGLMSDEAAQWM